MTTLYLIRGIPGSGKTTLAQSMIASGMADYFFEADAHMVDSHGNYAFNPSILGDCHAACQNETRSALMNGSNVAVSNTSTTNREVDFYQDIASQCGAKFVSIILENRHEGNNIHDVPKDKLQQMRNRFQTKL